MKMNKIEEYLEFLFPDPKCELVYNNDYQLLMSIVLSPQSTDKKVNTITPIIFSKYPNLSDLKNASIVDLENIIRPIGSFRKKARYLVEIASILEEKYDGVVPRDRDILESFPGVGRKTANVFLSEFYNDPFIAVDTHVERVSKRLGLVSNDDNVGTIEIKLMKLFNRDVWARRHLQMVLFGRYYCKAIKPECMNCRLANICKKNNN